ncbi:tetratricopeptide repeat protein [Phenylobacterium sp.]|uniref:tetratricopeptide repeat protein n=1 Tax=Phenylobacterium sp. TaxID=1871053 RepID=UPI003BAAF858
MPADPFPPEVDTASLMEAAAAMHRQGQFGPASGLYSEVLRREPDHAEAYHQLGLIAMQVRQPEKAVEMFALALRAGPPTAAMHANRGEALMALGRRFEAVGEYTRAIEMQPDLAEAYGRKGDAELALGRVADARLSFEQALARKPGLASAHLGLGGALSAEGRFDAALAAFQAAAALNPSSLAVHFNRGNVLRALGRVDEAIASYDAAIALNPEFAIGHHNRAFCLLQAGRLAEGFAEYEWRAKCPTFEDPRYGLPNRWTGAEDLAGKRLFIFPELFLGDVIQFSRYATMAAARGAKVTLGAPKALHGLLRGLTGEIDLVDEGATPDFDLQAPLMSLPHAFGTTLENLPGVARYISADPARVAKWRERIGPEGLKIGVVWQGSTQPYALPLARSFPLSMLARVGAIPLVRLISLQKVNGLDQLESLPAGMTVETLGDDFDPGPDMFMDTAAAMEACDFVITPDTSTAHLAGALGVRTLVALPYVADWRWLMGRTDSPWYPYMWLYRQTERGVWDGVFAEIENRLWAELA